MKRGKLLGIDVGEKRIGLAISDSEWTLATPLKTIKRTTKNQELKEILKIVKEEGIKKIILGLPVGLRGGKTRMMKLVEEFKETLEKCLKEENLGVEIEVYDERFSTFEARQRLMEYEAIKGKRIRDKKEFIDAISAQIILEDYMESHS